MSTCQKCGTATQSMAYHVCRPQMTEERVRRLATEACMAWHPTVEEEEKRVLELIERDRMEHTGQWLSGSDFTKIVEPKVREIANEEAKREATDVFGCTAEALRLIARDQARDVFTSKEASNTYEGLMREIADEQIAKALKSQPAQPENVTSCPACGGYEWHSKNCSSVARAFVEDALKIHPAPSWTPAGVEWLKKLGEAQKVVSDARLRECGIEPKNAQPSEEKLTVCLRCGGTLPDHKYGFGCNSKQGFDEREKDARIAALEKERDQYRADYRHFESMYKSAISEKNAAEKERDALREERDELRAQLPEGMKHCTITFYLCGKGHRWLSAKNWVQHDCTKCDRDALQSRISNMATHEKWLTEKLTATEKERDEYKRGADQYQRLGVAAEAERDDFKACYYKASEEVKRAWKECDALREKLAATEKERNSWKFDRDGAFDRLIEKEAKLAAANEALNEIEAIARANYPLPGWADRMDEILQRTGRLSKGQR